jgi:hypothetical protein
MYFGTVNFSMLRRFMHKISNLHDGLQFACSTPVRLLLAFILLRSTDSSNTCHADTPMQCTYTRICIEARRPSSLVTFHSHEYDWHWLELFRLGLGAGTCCV